MRARVIAAVVLVSTCGLSSAASAKKPEVVQVGPGTYMIFKEDHKGVFGSLAKLKVRVITQANEFAASRGQVVIPLACKEKPLGNGPAQWASFEYQFKLVPRESPEAKEAAGAACPDSVSHSTQVVRVTSTVEPTPAATPPSPPAEKSTDTYTELLKLDDLRKRGILTEEEFEAEKRKLLNPPAPPPPAESPAAPGRPESGS